MNIFAIFAKAANLPLMLPADSCPRETVFIAGKQPLQSLCSRYLIFEHDKLGDFLTSFMAVRNHRNEGCGPGKTGQIVLLLTAPIPMPHATIPTFGCSRPELGYIFSVCMNLITIFILLASSFLK